MSAVSSPVSCGEWPPKTVDQPGTLIGSPPAPLPWWRKPLPLPKLLVVPVVMQMATAAQVRTMRQVSDDRHADLRVPQQVIATIEEAVASGALDPAETRGDRSHIALGRHGPSP